MGLSLPTSFSSLADDFTSVQGALSQYIVTPLNAFGIGGFVFDVEGASTANLVSEVTDHYAEDNSFFQDNIATRPKQYILRGYVGELVDMQNTDGTGSLQTVVQKLTELNAILPALSTGTQQIGSLFSGGGFDSFSSAFNTISSPSFLAGASSLYAAVQNLLPATKQQAAFQYFKAIWQSKILVSLQTPFEFINNMAVINVVALQQEETKYKMDFAVTLKEIRYASTKTTDVNPASLVSPLSSSGGTPSSNSELPGGGLPPPVSSLPPNANSIASQIPIFNGSINGVLMDYPTTQQITPWNGKAPPL